MVEATNCDTVLESERLPDPCGDRQVTEVIALPSVPLSLQRVFSSGDSNDSINTDLIKNYLFEGGRLSKECLLEILRRAKTILNAEPNLVRVDGKVVIIGDIHGQFYDLIAMLRKLKVPNVTDSNQKLLFLGDYVDRGNYGPEVTAYLLALKIKFPN